MKKENGEGAEILLLYLLITELRFDEMLCSVLNNKEHSVAGHGHLKGKGGLVPWNLKISEKRLIS